MAVGVWERIAIVEGEPTLRGRGLLVADVLARLEAGEAPGRFVAASGLDPADLIAALAVAALGTGEDDGPPLVQQPPRRPRLVGAIDEPALAELLPDATPVARLALAAGLLQVHDFWDASHNAAQGADDRGERDFSAYWHGIAHRREPDVGNAAYWFRRVGRHPLFGPLGEAARPVIAAQGDAGPAARVAREDTWDSFAMIDLCDGARPGTPAEALARRLQRIEMIALLDATAAVCLR